MTTITWNTTGGAPLLWEPVHQYIQQMNAYVAIPRDLGEGDEGGSAGVREPRRPLPAPPSLNAALVL